MVSSSCQSNPSKYCQPLSWRMTPGSFSCIYPRWLSITLLIYQWPLSTVRKRSYKKWYLEEFKLKECICHQHYFPTHCGHFSAPAPVLDTVNLSGYDDVSSENYTLKSCIIIKVSMGKSIMTYKAIRLLNHLRWKIYEVQGWGKKWGKIIKITYICNFSYLKQTRYRHHPSLVHQNIASLSPEEWLLVASVGYIHGGYR